MDTGRKYWDFPQTVPPPEVRTGGKGLDEMYLKEVFLGMGRHFNLTPTEAFLFALIHSLSHDGIGWCFMAQSTMAEALNVSDTTINGLLEKHNGTLLEKGQRHERWKTIQWRLAPQALDHVRYLRGRIAKAKASKGQRV